MALSDTLVTYKIIKGLTTPFKKWKAYDLGLIDDKGNTLKQATTGPEKDSFPKWKRIIRKLKQLLARLPAGATKLGSFAAALWLLKEEMNMKDSSELEDFFANLLEESNILIESEEIINIVEKGMYEHLPSGEVVLLKNDVFCSGHCLGIPVFELTDFVSKKVFTTSITELRKIQ